MGQGQETEADESQENTEEVSEVEKRPKRLMNQQKKFQKKMFFHS